MSVGLFPLVLLLAPPPGAVLHLLRLALCCLLPCRLMASLSPRTGQGGYGLAVGVSEVISCYGEGSTEA